MTERRVPQLGIIRVVDGQPIAYEGRVDLSEEEYARYCEAQRPFARLTPRLAWGVVQRNYGELQTRTRFYGEHFSRRRPRGMVEARHAGYSIMTDVANWLTAFSLYLWHNQREYQKLCGERSEQLERFNRARHTAYDRSRDYRIAYELRNYVQHCGLPVHHLQLSALDDDNSKQRLGFALVRDDLLRDYEWRKVKPDVEAMPPTFDVLPVVDSAMAELRTIESETFSIDLDEAVKVAPILEEAIDRLGEVDGLPRLFRFETITADDVRIEELALPTPVDLEHIDRAAAGDHDALLRTPESTPPTNEEQARRYRLGIELMAVWLEEGELTPRVIQTINELIQLEGDVEQVITGAIQVAAYGLSLASQAAGSSPESFLGSLLENLPPRRENGGSDEGVTGPR